MNFSCDPLKDETYPSFDLFNRFCIPKQSDLIEKLGKTNLGGTNMEQVIEGISKAKYVIMGSILLAFLSAFLFSFFLENCAGIVITITMIGFYAGLIYLVYITNIKHKEYKTKSEADSSDTMSERLAKFFKACFWMCVGVLAITSCFLLCLFSRILLAIKVIKVSLRSKSDKTGGSRFCHGHQEDRLCANRDSDSDGSLPLPLGLHFRSDHLHRRNEARQNLSLHDA